MTRPYPVTTIKSYEELQSKLAELEVRDQDHQRCFRGQTHDHPLISSMARKLKKPGREAAMALAEPTLWLQAAREIASRLLPDPLETIPLEARILLANAFLQHYGFRSFFIDATQDPNIALCFALLRYRQLFPVFEGRIARPKVTRVAWYKSSTEPHGYLYVFDRPVWRPDSMNHGDMINLTALAPLGYNRIQHQRAVVLYSDPLQPGYGDLRPIVRAVYKFPNPLPGVGSALTEAALIFPNPGADPIYQSLLQSKFVEASYVTDRVVKGFRRTVDKNEKCQYLAQRYERRRKIDVCLRSLDIPEYHFDPTNPIYFDVFRSCDSVLEPTLYFPWFKERANAMRRSSFGQKLFGRGKEGKRMIALIKRARPILVHAPLEAFRRMNAGVAKVRFAERLLNVFLEFSPFNFVGPFAIDQTIRAIWLSGTRESFLLNVFGSAKGTPWMGMFHLFEWNGDEYVSRLSYGGLDMRPHFWLALGVMQHVSAGWAELAPPKRGEIYHQLRWPAERRWWELSGFAI